MTTSPQSASPRISEDLASGTGPQYRSLLCLSRKNRTSSPLQVLNFQRLVWTAGTVLPVLPIPAKINLTEIKVEEIKRLNHLDVELYEFAREVMLQRYESMKVEDLNEE